MIHIEHFTFNSFQTRCCVVWDDTLECAIVDPGCSAPSEIAALTSFIDKKGLRPVCIMLTHGHFDHVLGVAELVARYGIHVYMHPDDKFTLENNEYFCKWFGAPLPAAFETVDVRETASCSGKGCSTGNGASEDCRDENGCSDIGENNLSDSISTIKVGNLRFEVIETPGHTVGGVCYYEANEKVLFSGDTLFAGAIGRTDHPGGDYDQLIRNILEKLIVLDGSVTVIPGHGPCTDIAREGMTNPFLLPFNEPFEE